MQKTLFSSHFSITKHSIDGAHHAIQYRNNALSRRGKLIKTLKIHPGALY